MCSMLHVAGKAGCMLPGRFRTYGLVLDPAVIHLNSVRDQRDLLRSHVEQSSRSEGIAGMFALERRAGVGGNVMKQRRGLV